MEPRLSLRQERERRGWTQAEVAEWVGATELSVSRWERGVVVPRPYHRAQLATVFGLSEDALGLIAEPSSSPPSLAAHPQRSSVERTPLGIEDPTLPLLPTTPIVGREQDIAHIKQRLRTGQTIVLTALHGLPGVGKTTLALCLAHDQDVRAAFSDGILWAGLGPEPTVRGHLRRWGALLGLSSSEMDELHQYRAWETALRVAIGTRRLLLVVDDVWTIEDAWPFLVGGAHCAYLVTTRFPHLANQLVPDEATVIHELDTQQSVDLLGLLAPKAVVQERQRAQELAKVVGGLPLALTLIGNYLRQQSSDGHTRRIRAALERLSDARARLHLSAWPSPSQRSSRVSSEEMISLQSAISVSEQTLNEPTRAAFYALSVLPAKPESFSEEAASTVAQCSGETLDMLVDRGFLESVSTDRYTLHQIIADYARAHLQEHTPFQRLIDYSLRFLQEHKKAYEAQAQERHLIQAAIDAASTVGVPEGLVQVACAFLPFLLVRGEYIQAGHLAQHAYEAAQEGHDEPGSVMLLRYQGKVLQKQGHLTEAVTVFREGIERARLLNLQEVLCGLLIDVGSTIVKQSLYTEAEPFIQEGLRLARHMEHDEYVCLALNALSGLYADCGDYAQAVACGQEGLERAHRIHDPEQMVFLYIQLGSALSWQGKISEARPIYQEGLALARQMGHHIWIGTILLDLGVGALYERDLEQAEHYFQACVPLAQQTSQDEWVSVLHLNWAELDMERGQLDEAESHLRQSLERARHFGYTRLHAYVLDMLGTLALKRGQPAEAEHHFTTMASLLPEKDRDVEAMFQYGLARVAAAQGLMQEARDYAEASLSLLEHIHSHAARDVRAWIHTTLDV